MVTTINSGWCLLIGIAATIDLGCRLLIGIAATIGFACCTLIGTAATIYFGWYILIEMAATIDLDCCTYIYIYIYIYICCTCGYKWVGCFLSIGKNAATTDFGCCRQVFSGMAAKTDFWVPSINRNCGYNWPLVPELRLKKLISGGV